MIFKRYKKYRVRMKNDYKNNDGFPLDAIFTLDNAEFVPEEGGFAYPFYELMTEGANISHAPREKKKVVVDLTPDPYLELIMSRGESHV